MNHTPGPWYVSQDATRVLCGHPNDPEIVAECEVNDIMAVSLDDAPGNARLIAAAPAMLEGYKHLRQVLALVSPLHHSQGEALSRLIMDMDAILAKVQGP